MARIGSSKGDFAPAYHATGKLACGISRISRIVQRHAPVVYEVYWISTDMVGLSLALKPS